MRTLRLLESRTSVEALTDDQAFALARLGKELAGTSRWWGDGKDGQRDPGAVFHLTKLFGGQWQIRVGNVVGVVGLPDLNLIVEPKIGIRHFGFLLGSAKAPSRTQLDQTSLGSASELQGMVLDWFLGEVDLLLRKGLLKDYVPSRENLQYVRGRIDVVSSSRYWMRGRVEAECEFDDFTERTRLNLLIAHAIARSLASSWISEPQRQRLRQIREQFPQAPGEVPEVLDPKTLERGERHYLPAVGYALDILAGQGREMAEGVKRSGTFLLNSAAVVEEGVRQVLDAGLPVAVRKTGGRRLTPSMVSVNPDLEIGPPPFTGDVKYKVGAESWNRQDLAQAVLFAAAYRSPRALIVDFVDAAHLPSRVVVGDIEVFRARWFFDERVTAEAAAERLLNDVRQAMLKVNAAA